MEVVVTIAGSIRIAEVDDFSREFVVLTDHKSHAERAGYTIDIRDFSGARADWSYQEQDGTDNRAAIQAAMDQAGWGDVIELGAGYRKVGGELLGFRPVGFRGRSTSATHLIFEDCDGIDLDCSAGTPNEIADLASSFEKMSVATTGLGTKRFCKMTGTGGFGSGGTRLLVRDFVMLGADQLGDTVWPGMADKNELEWQIGFEPTELARVTMDNVYGKGNNNAFDHGFDTATEFIAAHSCTGISLTNVRLQRWKYGFRGYGTSDGVRLNTCDFVALHTCVRHEPEGSSNANVFFNCHFASSFCGIEVPESVSGGVVAIYVGGCFFLSRAGNPEAVPPVAHKMLPNFRHLRLKTDHSQIVNNVFYSNPNRDLSEFAMADIEFLAGSGSGNQMLGNFSCNGTVFYKRAAGTSGNILDNNVVRSGAGVVPKSVLVQTAPTVTAAEVYKDKWGRNFEDGLERAPARAQSTTTTLFTLVALDLAEATAYTLDVLVKWDRLNGLARGSQRMMATAYRLDAGAAALEGTVTQLYNSGTTPASIAVAANQVLVQVTPPVTNQTQWDAEVKFTASTQAAPGV